MAMKKITKDSGLRFDPHVVSAFLMLWKRKELESALSENQESQEKERFLTHS
jgi:HD-GYP domain-containing protein (c-di-GMP phosphodiesterase class II)